MKHSTLTTPLLFTLIAAQAALLFALVGPSARAEDPPEEESVEALEAPPPRQDLVCRYFELDEDDLNADARGEINTANPTGEMEAFMGDHATWTPHSMDFEMGQSLSGKPTYWVQICLSKSGS